MIFLEQPGAPDGQILEPGDQVLGPVKNRKTGETAWLVCRRTPPGEELTASCQAMLADPSNQLTIEPEPERPIGTFLWVAHQLAPPRLTDLPMPFRRAGAPEGSA